MRIEFTNDAKVDLEALASEIEAKTGERPQLKIVREPHTLTSFDPDTKEERLEFFGYAIEVEGLDEKVAVEVAAEHKPERSETEKGAIVERALYLATLRADVLEALPDLAQLIGKDSKLER